VSGYEKVSSNQATVSNNDNVVTLNAVCPGQKRAIGGGHLSTFASGSNSTVLIILSSGPNSNNTGWQVAARNNNDNASFNVTAYALCANVSP
jgi:hypothetical protein